MASIAATAKRRHSSAGFASDLWAFQISAILSAALELDVFSAIGKGKRTAAEVATATGSQVRGIERLLDTLTALKYLKNRTNRYGTGARSAATFSCKARVQTHSEEWRAANSARDVDDVVDAGRRYQGGRQRHRSRIGRAGARIFSDPREADLSDELHCVSVRDPQDTQGAALAHPTNSLTSAAARPRGRFRFAAAAAQKHAPQ